MSGRKERAERDEGWVRDWFKGHVATRKTFTEPEGAVIEYLRWAKPGTGTNAIHYYAFRRGKSYELLATGDLGHATYGWGMPELADGESIFDWIAGCDLGDFADKCGASEVGRQYREFDGAVAREEFLEILVDDPHATDEERAQAKQKVSDAGLDYAPASQAEWVMWLTEGACELLGDDWCHWAPDGMVTSLRCRGHLMGLKLATEQLRAKAADTKS